MTKTRTLPTDTLLSPYENIVIGNFLYGLGLAIGTLAKGSVPLACINLLQQTPLDPKLGDVLIEFTGMVRLLEFKRVENQSTKECNRLEALRIAIADQERLQLTSRSVHWYIESMPSPESPSRPIRLCPYLDMDTQPQLTDLATYVTRVASQAIKPDLNEPSPYEVREYLRCVGEMAVAGSATGGGMLVHVSPDGQLRFVGIADLRELVLQQGYLLSRQNEIEYEIGRQRNIEPELEQTMTPERSGPTHTR